MKLFKAALFSSLLLFSASASFAVSPYIGAGITSFKPDSSNPTVGEEFGGSGFGRSPAFFVHGGLNFENPISLEVELLYSENEETADVFEPGFGTIRGKQTVTGIGVFLNGLVDLAAVIEPSSKWIFQAGFGIGIANLKNDIDIRTPFETISGSDSDQVFVWQIIGNAGYRITERFSAGLTLRYLDFDDATWTDQGVTLEGRGLTATAIGLFAKVQF